MILHVDIETRSRVSIGNGLDRYTECPDLRILLVCYAFDDGEVQTWDGVDTEFLAALRNPLIDKMAWNARFEQLLFQRCLGVYVPDQQWVDPMVIVQTLGLPGKLGEAGPALGLAPELCKSSDGSRLIRKFCVPREPTKTKDYEWATRETDPEDWARFARYCEQDVVAEREIWKIVEPYQLQPRERAVWCLDGTINARGAPIDRGLVRSAIALDGVSSERLLARAKELTHLDNPNSVQQLLPWLQDRGYDRSGLDKVTVSKVLAGELRDDLREMLEIRQQLSKTSVAKFQKIENWCGFDNRARNLYSFAGAGRTGRWSGRGPQFQNLPRPIKDLEAEEDIEFAIELVKAGDAKTLEVFYGPVSGVLASLARATVRAPPGKKLVVVDFASIEVAVIAHLAHCPTLLQVFKDGKDPYKVFAAAYYGKPYEEVTKAERGFSKPPVLGCGFRLGAGEVKADGTKVGLLGYADSMGVQMTSEEATSAVRLYRESYPEIPQMWHALERAAKECVRTGDAQSACEDTFAFGLVGDCLRMRMPSGRMLNYWMPEIKEVATPWGEVRPTLTYLGKQQQGGKVARLSTHGGKLTENAVQAIARDVQAEGLLRAEAAAYPVVLHSHDEIVAEIDADCPVRGAEHLAKILCAAIPGLVGLPLGASGYTTIAYRKD